MGVMEDLDPEMCAQVYVDWEYRKVWDSYVLGEQNYFPTSLSLSLLLSPASSTPNQRSGYWVGRHVLVC